MASQEQHRLKQENIAAILGVLRRGDVTRRELCAVLGLSWACVSDLVNELIGQGLLTEEKADGGVAGRRPLVLSLDRDKRMLGVDINRMGLQLCLCDLYGEKIRQSAYRLEDASAEALTDCVCAAIDDMTDRQVQGIGLAMQGLRCTDGWQFPASGGRLTVDAAAAVRAHTGLPVWIEHDPNCILLGFADRPTGRMMTVRIDHGIGVSLCRNGQFSEDPLELGEVVIDGKRLKQRMVEDSSAQAGECLGQAIGNLSSLVAVDEIVLCGQRIAEDAALLEGLRAGYARAAVSAVTLRTQAVTDAALGAARLAVMRYPQDI